MANKPEDVGKSWLHHICGGTKDLMLSLLEDLRGLLLTSDLAQRGVLGMEGDVNFA